MEATVEGSIVKFRATSSIFTKHDCTEDKLLIIFNLFSSVYFDNAVLIDILKNMRRVHQNAYCTRSGDYEEDVQL